MTINPENSQLPSTWAIAQLTELVSAVEKVKPWETHNEFFRYIDISSIDNHTNRISQAQVIPVSEAPSRARQRVHRGDILFSTVRPYLRNIGMVPDDLNGEVASTGFSALRPRANIEPGYILYLCLSKEFLAALEPLQRGTSYPAVRDQDVKERYVPVPPRNEQRRIVAKIEELFSELDHGVESLKAARAQLKTYRQSLLKAAFEGRLTEQWRSDNADKLETADQLLRRIRHEREMRFKRRLEAWTSAMTDCGSDGKHGGKAKTRKPRAQFDVTPTSDKGAIDFPSIDRQWTEIGTVADVSGGITKNQKRQSFPVQKPFLRVANVYANELRLDDMHSIGVSPDEMQNATLELGDLLIVEGNGSVDQLGRVAVWDGSVPECVHQNHLIKVRPTESMISKYIMWFLLSTHGRTCIKGVASSTSGLHTLSISKVQKLPIPLCSTREQEEVVARIESGLTRVEHLEQTVGSSLARAESLRQSILKQAFEGRLVPQDPDDEPASALLERIRAEQKKETKSAKGRRKANA